jgi:MFS family permease
LATVATAFSFAPWYFYLCRFITGAGIGGEYAAINSAIDELIPARNRGQVDLTINGSYWVGSGLGAGAALLFLNEFAVGVGWRLAFGVGAVLGLLILLVRRTVPESPRWLFIHGREQQAERIVDGIEDGIRSETGQQLAQPSGSIAIRQRAAIPFREIAKVAWRRYPKRTVLGLSLFVGQAFLYNAVTFNLGTMLSSFFGVASGTVPLFIVIFAAGNFLGPLLLGRLFDTVGRRPMISGTYLLSAALTVLLAILLSGGGLTEWSFIALVGVTFFFASAGASAAYLTVSEVFPMETRALAIAFFYAVGTGLGGIIGPSLFGHMIDGGMSEVAVGFYIGAAVMALGGLAELLFGVRAERVSLENIAKPLTAADAAASPAPSAVADEQRAALRARERAEEERARAAEHRAAAHDLRPDADAGDRVAADRLRTEEILAEIAELAGQALDERAIAHDGRAAAEAAGGDGDRRAALERAEAAEQRGRVHQERAEALAAEHENEAHMHAALAEAAGERARALEQRTLADQARSQANGARTAAADVARAQAAMYDEWTRKHEARARAHESRAHGDSDGASRRDRDADRYHERALAAEERVDAARHRAAAEALQQEEEPAGEASQGREQAARRDELARERDERIRRRLARRAAHQRHGLRRFRPGPGRTLYSPGMAVTASDWVPTAEQDLEREIEMIARALDEHGPTARDTLAELVGARYWGPGRFGAALREAVADGCARRLSRTTYAPVEPSAAMSGR